MYNLRSITYLVIMSIAACAPTPPLVVNVPFDAEAGSWATARGSGSISGQAFLRQIGGGVVTCAGATVIAFPVTPYSSERMRVAYQSTDRGYNTFRVVQNAPPEFGLQARIGQCDAQGRFRIAELPAGNWYVVTRVEWIVANAPQGGSLMRRVMLASGQNSDEILTAP